MEKLNYLIVKPYGLKKAYVFFYLTLLSLTFSTNKMNGQWAVLTDGSVLPNQAVPEVLIPDVSVAGDINAITSIQIVDNKTCLQIQELSGAAKGAWRYDLTPYITSASDFKFTLLFRARPTDEAIALPEASQGLSKTRWVDFRFESGTNSDNFRVSSQGYNFERLMGGSTSSATVYDAPFDWTTWHTYRLTVDNTTKTISLYIDENPVVVKTGTMTRASTGKRIYFGDTGSTMMGMLVDYALVDVSGAYAPGEGSALPDLRSDRKDILSFTFPGQVIPSVIDPVAHTIEVNMPGGTDISNITPTIAVSPAATISPVITNFTNPVTYTVTAENGTTRNWTVTVSNLTAPDTPTAYDASEIGVYKFIANWDIPATGSPSTTCLLDVATDNAFTSFVTGFQSKDVGNIESFTVMGLAPNTTYYYRVATKNSVGNSVYSNTITLSTGTPVSSISISGQDGVSTISTKYGSLQMIAQVLPAEAIDKSVQWSCINGTGEAIINSSGVLFASKSGSVTVSATAKDGSGVTAQKEVFLTNQPYFGVLKVSTVSGAENIFVNGGSEQMSAEFEPANSANPSITWSVINISGIADITSSGLLTARKNGVVTVMATPSDSSAIGTMSFVLYNQLYTGIDDITKEEFTLFPNPVSKYLNIGTSDKISKIEILSNAGLLVKTISGVEVTEAIDLSGLSSGIYFARIYVGDEKIVNRKFMKQ